MKWIYGWKSEKFAENTDDAENLDGTSEKDDDEMESFSFNKKEDNSIWE